MTGHSDGPATGRTDALDVLSRVAATGVSRRQLVKLGGALALSALLPEWATPAPAAELARTAKRTGTCPPQRKGPCGAVRGRWTPECKHAIPNGKRAQFNGCGPQNGLDLPVLGHGDWVPDKPLGVVDFFDACEGHDCCYGRCGSDKSACDRAFLEGMQKACLRSETVADALFDGLRLTLCMNLASTYYAAVHLTETGQSAYDAGQAEVCDCCQAYTVRFDSKIDFTATAGSGYTGTFHLDYVATLPLTTPADGSAYASGTAQGSYAEALGTIVDDLGETVWSVTGAAGDAFTVIDYHPGAAPTITLDVGSPRETCNLRSDGGVNETFPAPLWTWAFDALHPGAWTGRHVTLALQPSTGRTADGVSIVAQGLFQSSADLGSASGGPPLDFSVTEYTAITVTAQEVA